MCSTPGTWPTYVYEVKCTGARVACTHIRVGHRLQYTWTLDSTRSTSSLILPSNPRIHVLGVLLIREHSLLIVSLSCSLAVGIISGDERRIFRALHRLQLSCWFLSVGDDQQQSDLHRVSGLLVLAYCRRFGVQLVQLEQSGLRSTDERRAELVRCFQSLAVVASAWTRCSTACGITSDGSTATTAMQGFVLVQMQQALAS